MFNIFSIAFIAPVLSDVCKILKTMRASQRVLKLGMRKEDDKREASRSAPLADPDLL
jgi:hypothetical protein